MSEGEDHKLGELLKTLIGDRPESMLPLYKLQFGISPEGIKMTAQWGTAIDILTDEAAADFRKLVDHINAAVAQAMMDHAPASMRDLDAKPVVHYGKDFDRGGAFSSLLEAQGAQVLELATEEEK